MSKRFGMRHLAHWVLAGIAASVMLNAHALDQRRVVKHGVLPHTGQAVVVAEGDLEPRSIGSYAVHLYAKNDPAYPYDRFLKGIVHARNGVLDALRFEDVDGDNKPEIIVIVRYAGSGNYLSADAFSPYRGSLRLVSSVAGLPADQDPITALKRKRGKRR